jgi:DNA-binding NarL/FixJ family response regulator
VTAAELRAHLFAADAAARADVLTLLRRAGIALASQPGRPGGTVIVAAASTAGDAIGSCDPGCLAGQYRLVIIADAFHPSALRRAVRLGARAMLRRSGATPAQLAAAVRSAQLGDIRMPHDVVLRLLSGAFEATAAEVPLTDRHVAILALMAQGHGNAAIARAMSCSEHTVKNASYDMMARLRVRNRAHAVAYAIRSGLI